MDSETEKLNFSFYLILSNLYLNSHMSLVATVVDSMVLESLSLIKDNSFFSLTSLSVPS